MLVALLKWHTSANSRRIIHLIIDFMTISIDLIVEYRICFYCAVHHHVSFSPRPSSGLSITWTVWLFFHRKNAAQNLTINLSRIVHIDPLSQCYTHLDIVCYRSNANMFRFALRQRITLCLYQLKINNDQLSESMCCWKHLKGQLTWFKLL